MSKIGRPEQPKRGSEAHASALALADTAELAKRVGLPTKSIIIAALGPQVAALAVRLGRREVATALHAIALHIDEPIGGKQ